MKNFIDTLKNIWKIEELRGRILTTLGLLLIYRIGSFVVLPGIDTDVLSSGGDQDGIAGLLSLFTGGAFSRASIFALGIMPYISASIIMQLLGIAVPSVQKMQKEGESGRKKINQWTRFLTVFICLFQAPGYIGMSVDSAAILNPSPFWWATTVLILITGTLFVMWLGERITEKGIGNGISMIIMVGIIASLPQAMMAEFVSKMRGGGGSLVMLLIELLAFVLVILVTILLVQGTRRIPVQFAKSMVGGSSRNVAQGARQFLPLKVNSSGVMPIIFAQAVMFLPAVFLAGNNSAFVQSLMRIDGLWYNVMFAVMIILFTYFYTAITVNPNEMADNLKKGGGFIPGIRPGKDTADFIDEVISRITFPGALFLAAIAILPAFAMKAGIGQGFAIFFGGTSLLIMVGVVLDTLQQIESHLLSRHYDGLMKDGGKVKGRSTSPVSGIAG